MDGRSISAHSKKSSAWSTNAHSPRQRRVSWITTKSAVSISHAPSEVGDAASRASKTSHLGTGESVVEISHWPAIEPLVPSLKPFNVESKRSLFGTSWRNCNCFGMRQIRRKPLTGMIDGPLVKINTSILPVDFFSTYQGNIKPESTALIAMDGTTSYTYEELNTLSDRLAKLLKPIIESEINSEHFREKLQNLNFELCVIVALKASEKWVIIILSIWKLGLPYLPIRVNENPPTRRVAKIIATVHPLVFIYSESCEVIKKTASDLCCTVCFEDLWKKMGSENSELEIEGKWSSTDRESELNIGKLFEYRSDIDPSARTSILLHRFNGNGELVTTAVRNCTVWNRVHAEWMDFPYSKNEYAAVYASVDSHEYLGQMLAPLLAGIPVVAIDVNNLYSFAESVAKWKIQRLQIFPELLRAILVLNELLEQTPDASLFNSVKRWFCTGGSLRRELAVAFFRHAPKKSELINLYGCREALSYVCYEKFNSLEEVKHGQYYDILPIGRPVINTRIYILDEDLQVTEDSGLGEVFISGLGVYNPKALDIVSDTSHDDEDKNTKIVPNPFLKERDEPMYRIMIKTSDFGKLKYSDANKYKRCSCFLKDQPTLQFAGNEEGEATIENYRINTNELIFHIKSLPTVKACHVMIYRPGTQSMAILAFVVVAHRHKLTKEDVHQHLQERVPKYMLPAIIFIPGIPVRNFKINNSLLVEQYQKDRMMTKESSASYEALVDSGHKDEFMAKKAASVLWRVFFHCCGVGKDWAATHMQLALGDAHVQYTALPTIYKELSRHGYNIDLKRMLASKTPQEILKLMIEITEINCIATEEIDGNSCGQFMVEVISGKHKDEILKLLLRSNFDVFYPKSLFYYCDMKEKEVRQTIVDIWPLIIVKKISIGVRDKSSKKLVAALLNADHVDKMNSKEWGILAKRFPHKYFTELLGEIDERMSINGLTSSKVMQTLFFLVDKTLENRYKHSIQVMKLLITRGMEVARNVGFEALYMPIFDYVYSNMIAEAFDFDIIDSKQINTFEAKDGAKPFGLAPDNISGTVLHRVL